MQEALSNYREVVPYTGGIGSFADDERVPTGLSGTGIETIQVEIRRTLLHTQPQL